MSKLNANAKLWVKALRSGKYKQAKEVLSDRKGYCCLGVACEVYQKKVGDLVIDRLSVGSVEGKKVKCVSYDNEKYTLPDKVRKWLGLSENDGCYEADSLVGHNDKQDFNFKQIARVIESMPDGLF